jgi:hypothetical protein
MNWKLIFLLSLFGLAMAIATVFVIPSKIEPAFWLAIFIVCAVIIAKRCSGRYFLHGLAVSLVNCLWITTAHVALYDAYAATHVQEVGLMAAATSTPPRVMMAVTGPIIGLVSGVVLGLFAVVASKVVKK